GRLERARKAYLRAEGYRKTGKVDFASLFYEKAKFLCPGSRFDYLSSVQLRTIYAAVGTGSTEAGEEQPDLYRRGERDAGKCLEEEVAELLEACQRAYADGRFHEAAEFA